MPLYTSKFVFTPPQENIMLLSYKAKKNKVEYLFSFLHNAFEVNNEAKKKRNLFRTKTLVRVRWIRLMKCSVLTHLRQHPEDGHLRHFSTC